MQKKFNYKIEVGHHASKISFTSYNTDNESEYQTTSYISILKFTTAAPFSFKFNRAPAIYLVQTDFVVIHIC